MTAIILIALILWLGLPVLAEVLTHYTTRLMKWFSDEIEGFWDVLGGVKTPLRPHLSLDANDLDLADRTPVKEWHANGMNIPVRNVKLTEDWELPTLVRELNEGVAVALDSDCPDCKGTFIKLNGANCYHKLEQLPIKVNPEVPREMVFPEVKNK